MILTQEQLDGLRGYTPGPWTVDVVGDFMRISIPDLGSGGEVAQGYVGRQNALLMAAGPDLLDTLDAVARERDDLRADQTASPNEETAKLRKLVADYRLLLQNLYEQAEDRNGTESGAISVLLHQVNAITKENPKEEQHERC